METQQQSKRTKRHLSSSPHTAAPTVSSTSSTGEIDTNMNSIAETADQFCGSISSRASSSEVYQTTEEEEEDMAYCLILLAQGDVKPQPSDDGDENCCRAKKISSRKFFDVSTATTNEAGFFVYECKTCNRSFPSFQALGGHSASHKKPKSAVSDHDKKPSFLVPVVPPSLTEDRESDFDSQLNGQIPPNFSLQISSNKTNSNNNRSKIHECSICGSEFTSGQALGGHMRRHRANNGANNNNQVMIGAVDHVHQVKPRNILALDLNLPAPEEDHRRRESKFQFPSTQQGLVFSAPALVDCYH